MKIMLMQRNPHSQYVLVINLLYNVQDWWFHLCSSNLKNNRRVESNKVIFYVILAFNDSVLVLMAEQIYTMMGLRKKAVIEMQKNDSIALTAI